MSMRLDTRWYESEGWDIGTSARAQCDHIVDGMDDKIKSSQAAGGAYGEIVGHLKSIGR